MNQLPDHPGVELFDDQAKSLIIDSINIQLLGLSCTQLPDPDANRLKEIISQSVDNHPDVVILLYHAPDIAPRTSD